MKHITTLALIAFAVTAKAQVAQIVSTDGGKLSTSTISIDYTVGDIAVEPLSQGSLRLFEGFQAVNYAVSLITGIQSETAFAFYPNPTQKFLTIDADLSPGSTFRVTDISGKDLELPAELTAHRAIVDVSSLPSSLYVLTIQDKSGIVYRVKFLKAL
jgi:hypothetical protein